MDNLLTETMREALYIAGFGTVILFGALACLVGLMYLLTTLLRDREPAPLESAQPVVQSVQPVQPVQRATAKVAAIAVALARAEAVEASAQARRAEAPQSTGGWWTFHLQRQLLSHIHTVGTYTKRAITR